MAWLTKTQKRNLWRLIFAIPVRTTGDRWGHWWLYELELEHGARYIGITRFRSVRHRYQEHLSGKGAKWTKLHPPIRIAHYEKLGHMIERDAVKLETDATLRCIAFWGVDKVRGGKLVSLDAERHRRQYEKLKKLDYAEYCSWFTIGS